MTRAFLFPGQGSQAVGMGKALADAFAPAREVFEEIDDALASEAVAPDVGRTRSRPHADRKCPARHHGGELAIVRILQREAGLDLAKHARLVAGHSLGEYTALAPQAPSRWPMPRGFSRRAGGRCKIAVPVGEGAMSALIGAEIETGRSRRERGRRYRAAGRKIVCVVANDNAPGQVVISGTKAAVERAGEIAKAKGAKRAMLLDVSAPFHSPLMQPAADEMREALAEVTIRPPAVPVLANVTATQASEPETIRRLLVEQVTARVRWRESVLAPARARR